MGIYSPDSLANKNYANLIKYCSNFDLKHQGYFDLIWMEQAFHHIEPRYRVPKKLLDLLRPGGYVVISEANGLNPFLQYQMIRKRGLHTIVEFNGGDGKVHMFGNERITTARRIARLFVDNGFKLKSTKYFRTLPNFTMVDKFSWIDHIIPKWFSPAYTHFNIVFRKPS